MGDWDEIKRKSAETNQLIWDSETNPKTKKREVNLTKSGEEVKTRFKSISREGDKGPQYENYAVEVNITQDGDSDGSNGEFVVGTYQTRFFTVDLDPSGADMGGVGGLGRDVEEGRLQVLTGGSADSGCSRRRASHEGTIRQTVLPNHVDVAGM